MENRIFPVKKKVVTGACWAFLLGLRPPAKVDEQQGIEVGLDIAVKIAARLLQFHKC